jgi:uncharacterized protein YecE (DUF72 family)
MVTDVDATVLRVGCPMWAHASWVDRFVSSPAKGRQLADYASWCNAVEGNTTFYAVPSAETVERWQALAPPEFRFAFKVPKVVTHDRRLRHADAELAGFLSAIEPLGERIGPIQIQLPPSFGPESLPQLAAFVHRLPAGFEWVVELRHPALFDRSDAQRRVDEMLRAANIGRVVLDARPLYAEPAATPAAVEERRSKPRLPVLTESMGDAPVVRLIGASSREVTKAGLLAWVPQVVDWLASGRRPYVFVHQPENRDSPLLARELHAAVAAVVPSLAPLPTPPPRARAGEVPGQSTLF